MMESTQTRANESERMLLEIHEGLAGSPHFETIYSLRPAQVNWILFDMAGKWSRSRMNWSSVHAFVHNYAERALRLMEPFVPFTVPTPDMTTELAISQYHTALWEEWAQVCEQFLNGS